MNPTIIKIIEWIFNLLGLLKDLGKNDDKRPEVIIKRVEDDKILEKSYFIAKNIGQRTGLNIKLETINLNVVDFATIIFEFKPINSLDPNEETRIEYDVYVLEKDGTKVLSNSARKLYFIIFHPKYQQNRNYELKIEYKDSFGRKYITEFGTGKDGLNTKKIYLNRIPEVLYKKIFRFKVKEHRLD